MSVGTTFAVLGVALGVSALATVISVTGGFRSEFRTKVLGAERARARLEVRERFSRVPQSHGAGEVGPRVIAVAPFSDQSDDGDSRPSHDRRAAKGTIPRCGCSIAATHHAGKSRVQARGGQTLTSSSPEHFGRPASDGPSGIDRSSAALELSASAAPSGSAPSSSRACSPKSNARSETRMRPASRRARFPTPARPIQPKGAGRARHRSWARRRQHRTRRRIRERASRNGRPSGWLDPDPCKSPEAVRSSRHRDWRNARQEPRRQARATVCR